MQLHRHVFQVGEQFVDTQVALVAIADERSLEDPLEWRGDEASRDGGDRLRIASEDRGDQFADRRPFEWRLSGQCFVEHHTDTPDVGARVEMLEPQLLGGHVLDRAAHDAGPDHLLDAERIAHEGQSEVEHLHVAVIAQHDVIGLDVAVDDAGRLGRGQRACHLREDVDDLADVESALRHPLAKRDAFHELGGDERMIVDLSDLVDGENVRMVERRRGLRFMGQAIAMLATRHDVAAEYLQRHGAPKLGVSREIDLPHATRADGREDLVATEPGSRRERHQ